jgi:hypothetical protein
MRKEYGGLRKPKIRDLNIVLQRSGSRLFRLWSYVGKWQDAHYGYRWGRFDDNVPMVQRLNFRGFVEF